MTDRQTQEPADAGARRAVKPVVCYPVAGLPPVDHAFLERVRSGAQKVDETIVPARDARTFEVPAGHLFRIVSIEGPQVGDLNLWNLHDLGERFFSGKTRALHATHVTLVTGCGATCPTCGRLQPLPTTPSAGTASTNTAAACTM